MRALVTGGAGFIGSHVVDALLDEGADVAIVDHLTRSPRPWVTSALNRGAQLHVADVRDLGGLVTAFEDARPDVVLHLAAQVDVRRSVADPSLDAQVNVAGTVSVLEAALRAGARRLVLASTAAIYGEPETLPTPETAPAQPLSPYGTSKAAAEWYLAQYARLYGLSTLALRMANVYGPRQDPRGEAGVVSIFCGAAAEGRPVTIFGDGRQSRDYIHVDDVCRAWVAAARSDADGVLNVSTGVETTLLGLVEHLGVEPVHLAGRPGEVAQSCLDSRRASEALGWAPGIPLVDGLRTMRPATCGLQTAADASPVNRDLMRTSTGRS